MYAISIDMGGTYVKTGILKNGNILEKGRILVSDNRDFDALLPSITEEVNRLLTLVKTDSSHLEGIAIAFPGLVDSKKMQVAKTHKYPTAADFDFKKWASINWNTELLLINDARMAGIGEWKAGAGNGTQNMLMLTLGTGIGSFAVVDGHMLQGNKFRAGNLAGHLTLDYKGEICQCGNVGCAESLVASWQLPQLVKADSGFTSDDLKDVEKIDYKWLFDLYRQNHPGATRIAEYCMNVWSVLVVNMIHTFDPEVFVMGGGIMNSADLILPYMRKEIEKYCWLDKDEIVIEHASLGEDASLVGGYYLVKDLTNNVAC